MVPIKPIHNVITLQEDITTEKCRQVRKPYKKIILIIIIFFHIYQSLQRELKGWKAGCVIHDGAPNVETAWIQDAFSQGKTKKNESCLFLINYLLPFYSYTVFEGGQISVRFFEKRRLVCNQGDSLYTLYSYPWLRCLFF